MRCWLWDRRYNWTPKEWCALSYLIGSLKYSTRSLYAQNESTTCRADDWCWYENFIFWVIVHSTIFILMDADDFKRGFDCKACIMNDIVDYYILHHHKSSASADQVNFGMYCTWCVVHLLSNALHLMHSTICTKWNLQTTVSIIYTNWSSGLSCKLIPDMKLFSRVNMPMHTSNVIQFIWLVVWSNMVPYDHM